MKVLVLVQDSDALIEKNDIHWQNQPFAHLVREIRRNNLALQAFRNHFQLVCAVVSGHVNGCDTEDWKHYSSYSASQHYREKLEAANLLVIVQDFVVLTEDSAIQWQNQSSLYPSGWK